MTSVAGQIKRINIKGSGTAEGDMEFGMYLILTMDPAARLLHGRPTNISLAAKGEASYTPLFTFHIFRYMEISGMKYKPEISDIEGLVCIQMLKTGIAFHAHPSS